MSAYGGKMVEYGGMSLLKRGEYHGSGKLLCTYEGCKNTPTKYVLLNDSFWMLCDEHYNEYCKDANMVKTFPYKNSGRIHLSFFWWRS